MAGWCLELGNGRSRSIITIIPRDLGKIRWMSSLACLVLLESAVRAVYTDARKWVCGLWTPPLSSHHPFPDEFVHFMTRMKKPFYILTDMRTTRIKLTEMRLKGVQLISQHPEGAKDT